MNYSSSWWNSRQFGVDIIFPNRQKPMFMRLTRQDLIRRSAIFETIRKAMFHIYVVWMHMLSISTNRTLVKSSEDIPIINMVLTHTGRWSPSPPSRILSGHHNRLYKKSLKSYTYKTNKTTFPLPEHDASVLLSLSCSTFFRHVLYKKYELNFRIFRRFLVLNYCYNTLRGTLFYVIRNHITHKKGGCI